MVISLLPSFFRKLVFIFLLLLSLPVLAVGGFGGPTVGLGPIADEELVFIGGYGAGILPNNWYFGGGGYGASGSIVREIDGVVSDYDIAFGYGGVILGYSVPEILASKPFFQLMMAWGGVALKAQGDQDEELVSQALSLLKPSIGLNWQMTGWMQIGISADYQTLVGGFDESFIKRSELEGLGFSLHLRFGYFNKR